jgi:hypothetical protein
MATQAIKGVQKVKTYSGFDFFVPAHQSHTNSKMYKLTFLLHPPPRTAVKSYIEHLNKLTKVAVSKSGRGRSAKTKAAYEPLEIQIARWWANLPEAMKDRSFQITEIAGVCGGKSLERPALRNVAAALRALGWKEYRDWTASGRNRRFWIPSLPR